MNWNISSLDRELPSGVVITAHWRVSKTDGATYGTAYGTIALTAKDPSDPTFVPYEDLTEPQVVQWVKDAMGPEQVAAHEAAVQAQIDQQLNPTTGSGTPWTS
jgi:hypothetical protein